MTNEQGEVHIQTGDVNAEVPQKEAKKRRKGKYTLAEIETRLDKRIAKAREEFLALERSAYVTPKTVEFTPHFSSDPFPPGSKQNKEE